MKVLGKSADTLAHWIAERESIRKQRAAGKPAPWTNDPLIAGTRWCNVRRMDDKVSQWLIDHWYRGARVVNHTHAVTFATIARLVNWPDTLAEYKLSTWNRDAFCRVLHRRKDAGQKVFTGVYIINSASGGKGSSKIDVIADTINTVRGIGRELVDTNSMQNTHSLLRTVPGIGSFIAGQIVADLRWVVRGDWADRQSWAPHGPGSMRGIEFMYGQPVHERDFCEALREVRGYMIDHYSVVRMVERDRSLELHDWQNVLCEVSKLARLMQGGRSKNKYEVK